LPFALEAPEAAAERFVEVHFRVIHERGIARDDAADLANPPDGDRQSPLEHRVLVDEELAPGLPVTQQQIGDEAMRNGNLPGGCIGRWGERGCRHRREC
jgi:hypothetical protein